jgi:hypothetical protein
VWSVSVAAACAQAPDIDAPPPLVVDDLTDSLPPAPPSVIASEIRYELAPALEAMEKAVPRRFGDIGKRLQAGDNRRAHFAFAASRAPFRISFDGRRATVSTTVEYEGRGWYNPPIGPEVSAACGTGGVPRPRARVRIQGDLALTPDWSISARSRVSQVAPASDDVRDRCRVTVFRIDVTEKVMTATRGVLDAQLRTLDRSIARVQTRERVERWWRDISRPIRLADSVWFVINPRDVTLEGIRNDSGGLTADVRLVAGPRILTGGRPNDFELFTPLPPLQRRSGSGPANRGMLVTVDGELGYDVASAMLRRALVQKRIDRGARHVIVEDVEVMGIGAGRIALGVRFGGSLSGRMWLTGSPVYDPGADQLLVPDLEFDLQTSSALVRSLAWLKDDAIITWLRERARFPVSGQLSRLRELAERGMNREFTTGVRLVARLDDAKPVSVMAYRSALRVRATATGVARLEIDKPLGRAEAPAAAAAPAK